MSEQPEELIRAALKDGCRAHCDSLIHELRRLSAIEDEWARLSQDDGKAERAIARLSAVNAELMEALKQIAEIPEGDWGGGWDEVEKARVIARGAIVRAEEKL